MGGPGSGKGKTSAAILHLRGSFDRHPERARDDLPGAGPMDDSPPEILTGKEIAAWREILAGRPLVAFTETERGAFTQLARIWAALKDCPVHSPDFIKLDGAYRQWCVQMGMTLASRAKLGTSAKKPAQKTYADLKG